MSHIKYIRVAVTARLNNENRKKKNKDMRTGIYVKII